MPKIQTLQDNALVSTINENNDKIETAFANTLSRDGSAPNGMGANLDMNGYRIINVASIDADEDVSFDTFDATTGTIDQLTSDQITSDNAQIATLTGTTINVTGKVEIFTGQDGGWRDMIGQIVPPNSGPTVPTWTQIGSSPFYAYAFAVNDQCWHFYHIQHDYAPGTPVYLHAHWLPSGTNTQPVKWEFTWTYSKGFNQANYNVTGTTVTVQEAPPGSAYRHMTTEIATPITTDFEVDGILMVRLRRITNGGTNNTDNIFLTMADAHYQSNTFNTKNRTPDFYE